MKDKNVEKDFVYYFWFCVFGLLYLGPGVIGFGYPFVRALIKEIFK